MDGMHHDARRAVYDAQVLRAMAAASATDAVRRAEKAVAEGDLATASAWARRAHRIAPRDITVQILFASIVVHTDPNEAVSELEAATRRLPWHREAAMALVAALLRAGRSVEAAETLDTMLGRMTPPATDVFQALAALVCDAASRPGWVAFNGRGECRVLLMGPARSGSVRLAVDGQPPATVRVRPGRLTVRSMDEGWQAAHTLEATVGEEALIGSGLDPSHFCTVEGFVAASPDGTVRGWARLRADPETVPAIYRQSKDGRREPVPLFRGTKPESITGEQSAEEPDGPIWRFDLPQGSGTSTGRVEIVDGAGRNLWGSPVAAGAERNAVRQAARAFVKPENASPDPLRPLPASLLPRPAPPLATPPSLALNTPPCDVVVPIYIGTAELDACLLSLEATLPRASRLILVNDGSPDPAIAERLGRVIGRRVTVLTHALPRGFPSAVNTGLVHLGPDRNRDVVILNADTVVGAGWLERLSAVAHSDPAIGSCTPLSNDGTLVSYPEPGKPGDAPGGAELEALNALCWEANGADAVDIPTGVGFCMLMKGACLAEVGPLRDDVFAQGYGEENDWCLRAAHLGWRNVAAPGVFVSHSGGRSFGAAKTMLLQRNAAVLERLHPGYEAYVKDALAAEPLRQARRRIDRLKLLRSPGQPATALITHDDGGGVERHVAWRCAALAASGRRPIVLFPAGKAGQCSVSLGAGEEAAKLPNLRFDLPDELPALASLLTEAGVAEFEIHHLLNHDPSVTTLPALLGAPYDVYVHDYGHWCPRITLTSRGQRYCGEPLSPDECEECIADLGSRYGPEVTVRGLRARSTQLLDHARRVAVSCNDVAGRIRRQFPSTRPEIVAWEDPSPALPAGLRRPGAGREVHVVVVGAIGIEKGYDVLLGCARDAARRELPLRFTVVGYTTDDDRLMASGRLFVTGRFEEGEGLALVREQRATLGLVPSVWPETWCYALSLLMQAGLPVCAFALGAQSERIERAATGWLLPVGISVTKLNDALVSRGLQTLHTGAAIPFETGVR